MRIPSIRRVLPVLVVISLVTFGSLAVVRAPVGGAAAVAPAPTPTPAAAADGRLIVGLEAGATGADAAAIARDAGATGATAVDEHTIVVDAPAGGADATPVAELRADDRVKYVEPNYRISSSYAPNDPSFPSLTALADAQPGGIRAQSAWGTTIGSRDVVVGVLDSGIDAAHPDLVANLWSNRQGIGGCPYGTHGYNSFTKQCTTSDEYGHGTHVAGIIGAVGNNGVGITGVAPRVGLMSLAMLDRDGNGSIAGAIAAIDWAVKAKQAGVDVRVLSASWGGVYSQGLTDAIARAGAAGILLVTAAGNRGANVEQAPVFPCAAGLPNVVCVAASGGNDALTAFSDFGAAHVDLAAPGQGILSTVPPGVLPECGASLYCALDGTSMATPMVTGAAVLAVTANPGLSVTALRALLVRAVDPIPSLTGKVVSGGRLDVCKAVPGCGATPRSIPSPPTAVRASAAHGRATLRWAPPSANGGAGAITGYVINAPGGARLVGPGVRELTATGLADNVNVTLTVQARNAVGDSPPVMKTVRPFSGALVVQQSGRLARVVVGAGASVSETTVTDLAPGQGQARGVALMPDGAGGYVLDGFGGLHPFGVGGNPPPPPAAGGRYAKGNDWARGVALMPDGGAGYVVDRSGKLYGFSIGNHMRPPATNGLPAWTGDVARGIAINAAGDGGYVLDGAGRTYGFGVRSAAPPPPPTGAAAWPGQDMARGIALSRGRGGGYVVDRAGGLHPFGTLGQAPPTPLGGPPWPGLDLARGVAL